MLLYSYMQFRIGVLGHKDCQKWDSNPRLENQTATWTQRLRPLGHPDICKPVFGQDSHNSYRKKNIFNTSANILYWQFFIRHRNSEAKTWHEFGTKYGIYGCTNPNPAIVSAKHLRTIIFTNTNNFQELSQNCMVLLTVCNDWLQKEHKWPNHLLKLTWIILILQLAISVAR